MWFDVKAELSRARQAEQPHAEPGSRAIPAIRAISDGQGCRGVAQIARIARADAPDCMPEPAPVIAAMSDAETFIAFLRDNGPASYGAAAKALGWGATRAWRAQAAANASQRIDFDRIGRAAVRRPSAP